MTDAFCAAEVRLFDSYRIPFEGTLPAARRPGRRDRGPRDGQRRPGRLRPRQRHVRARPRAPPTCPSARPPRDDRPRPAGLRGCSDPYSYTGRPLREHAVAQLDLGARRARTGARGVRGHLAGRDVGAQPGARGCPGAWSAVIALGGGRPSRCRAFVPTRSSGSSPRPGLGRLAARGPAPKSAGPPHARACLRALGQPRARAHGRTSSSRSSGPGWLRPAGGRAMWSRLRPRHALRPGAPGERARATRSCARSRRPWRLVWGDRDVYGGPEIGERAAALLPDARARGDRGRPRALPRRAGVLRRADPRRATMGPRSRMSIASDATDPARG